MIHDNIIYIYTYIYNIQTYDNISRFNIYCRICRTHIQFNLCVSASFIATGFVPVNSSSQVRGHGEWRHPAGHCAVQSLGAAVGRWPPSSEKKYTIKWTVWNFVLPIISNWGCHDFTVSYCIQCLIFHCPCQIFHILFWTFLDKVVP